MASSSGSPRSRIDQFFPSRKWKQALVKVVKDEKNERDQKSTVEVSPGAKGTLDGFLVKSPGVSSPVVGRREEDDNRGEQSGHALVKRNLTLEIQLGPETVKNGDCVSKSLGKELESEDGNIERRTAVSGALVEAGNENSKLKRFATDFLSLYCSDIQSAENLTSEENSKGHKRNGSPSLLVQNEKVNLKKYRLLVDSCSPEIEKANQVEGSFEPFNREVSDKVIAGGPGVGYDSKGFALASLRRCSTTPNSDVAKACSRLGSSETVIGARQTPKSTSPGDDFWDEAIQVADVLIPPADNLSVQVARNFTVKNKRSPDNLQLIANQSSSNKLVMNRHLPDVPPKLSKSSNNNIIGDNRQLESSKCLKELETDTGDSKLSTVYNSKAASPVPIKHFDFLSEEHNLQDKKSNMSSFKAAEVILSKQKGNSKYSPVITGDHQSSSTSVYVDDLPGKIGVSRKHIIHQKSLVTRDDSLNFVDSPESCSSDLVPKDQIGGQKDENIPSSSNKDIPLETKNVSLDGGATTPSSNKPLKDCLHLHNWLPQEICRIYMRKGISGLYPWQADCLQIDGVLERRNLVYCASTSAGKSFVAEILMLRRVLSTGKMALLVLPYVSICAEKADHLEALLEPLGKHVRSFYGNQGGGSLPKDTSVAVCTIEKANSLVNKLLEEGRLSEVGIIVIDELHMVGDQHRGYLLELLLTKLRYASGQGNSDSSSGESSGSSSGKADVAHGVQVVGMSATMPNVSAVADWLQAALYQTEFRPVPLEEYIKVGNTILNTTLEVVRTISRTSDLGGKDPDHIVELCNEIVQEGHSVLCFCSSRKGCESTARHISKFLKKLSTSTQESSSEFTNVYSAIEALRKCPAGLDSILEETLPCGVAYHHAGLTVEEREIVETCYRKGLIHVLTATSTLAAGVNLPARRVIFRQPRIGRDFIDGTRYRQMAGRAGRTGIDTKGESILICKPEEVKRIASILNDSCPPLQSCLSDDKNGMVHAILEVVSGGIVQTATDIHRYVRCTLLNSTRPFQDVVKSAQDSLRWLCHKKFLEWNEETRLYCTTPLGRASFGSSLSPEESLVVLDDLSRAREGFVLASDLHLVYLVTPINVEVEPDWELYYERFMELSTLDQSVGTRVGVTEPFLMHMAHGAPMHASDRTRGRSNRPGRMQSRGTATVSNCSLDNQIRISKRFFVSLMLAKLVQEIPIVDVCDSFNVARGMIQSLQENAGRFASMVAVFCERLGWHDLEGLIGKFQNRVSFGVRAEIVELTAIPHVKVFTTVIPLTENLTGKALGSRARALYKAGLRSPLAIAEASTAQIAKALFESSSWAADDSAMRRIHLGVAKKIKNGARKIVLDKAEEARVAAFSAFQSLGVQVPQFPVPPLPSKLVASEVQVDTVKSSNEWSLSSIRENSKESQVSSKPQHIKKGHDNLLVLELHKKREIKDAKVSVYSEALGNNIRDSEYDVLVEGPQHTCSPLVRPDENAIENQAAPSEDIGFGDDVNDIRDLNHKYDTTQGDNGGNISNASAILTSDRGPVNVGSTPVTFDLFMHQWEAAQEFYFDIHFSKKDTSTSSVIFEIFGIAICWRDSPIYYINLSRCLASSCKLNASGDPIQNSDCLESESGLWEIAEQRWNGITKIMGKCGVRKFTWNLKSQIQVLQNPGISIQRLGRLRNQHKANDAFKFVDSTLFLPSVSVTDGIDICLVVWILWPDEESTSSPNLEKVVKKRLPPEVAAAATRDSRWRNQMRKAAHNGCCRRVSQTRALALSLWKLLISEDLVEALLRIESPLVKVLAYMELCGIGVDIEACIHARSILGKKLKELEKEAFKLAGFTFSLYSAADIANVLYTQLKLPIPDACNKGKQHYSTNKHTLDMLRDQHPIVPLIKEHRTLAKLLNSTLGSLCSKSQLCFKSQKYIIRGRWLQTSTATGRLSMEEPNLQCVEHAINFTTHSLVKDGPLASQADHHQINARDFFGPMQDNWVLVTADYSQIELRLMAHFSGDILLIELLSRPDGDVFTMLAAKWTKKLEAAVSSEEREQTKRLVYGILYGMGANTLAEQLDCNPDEAAEKIQSFKASFPRVSAWLQNAVASCRSKGYVETLMGRKRFLSKIKFGNSKEKAKAQRQAVNSICQGSAADIIKIAMINIYSVIVEGCNLPTIKAGDELCRLKGNCRILLQVHDELLLEVNPSLLKEAALVLQFCMENAASLLVPLRVKVKVGKTWGSLQPFEFKS